MSESTIKIVIPVVDDLQVTQAGGVPLRVYPERTENTGFRVALRLHGMTNIGEAFD